MAKMMLSAGMSSTTLSSKVGLKRPLGVEHRRAAHGAQAAHLSVLVQDLARAARIVQVDALLRAFVDFDLVGRHLVAGFQADHVNFLVGAEAQRGTGHVVGQCRSSCGRLRRERGHVVGHVAAADHQHPLAQRQGSATVEGAQKVHAVDDAFGFRSRQRSRRPLGRPMPRKIA